MGETGVRKGRMISQLSQNFISLVRSLSQGWLILIAREVGN